MPTRRWGLERIVNTTTDGPQRGARVAALAGGGFVVAWYDDDLVTDPVRAQVFDALGNPVGAEIAVGISGTPAGGVAVTGLADGGFLVSWAQRISATDTYVQGRVYTAAGALVREQPAIFDTAVDRNVEAARLGSGAAVAWVNATASQVGLRIFDAAGVGGAVQNVLSAPSPLMLTGLAVAATADAQRLAVGWRQGGQILAKIYNPAGTALVQTSLVTAAPGADLSDPVLAWSGNRVLAVGWRIASATFTPVYDLYVQFWRVSDTANPAVSTMTMATAAVRVNAALDGARSQLVLTALPGGGVVASWSEGNSVRLQGFDGSGNRLGGILEVTAPGETGTAPSIAALADGRVAVTWAGPGDADADDVHVQIVDPRDGIVVGTVGNDMLYGHDLVADEISGGNGNDSLFGLRGDDALFGGAGDDVLDGGRGADDMAGGTGNDTYVVDSADDTIAERAVQGIDTVQSAAISLDLGLYANVERAVLLGSLPLFARGSIYANTLDGSQNSAANVLTGLAGNDLYVIGAGDTVVEAAGGGVDTVASAAQSLNLATLANIENLSLLGAAALSATGNSAANVLDGSQNGAANVLTGLAGNDTYVVGAGDTIVEAAGGGTDTVSSALISLSLASYANVENVTLLGALTLSATGNAGANVLDGAQNSAANKLTGLAGNDTYIIGPGDTVVEAAGGGQDQVRSSLVNLDLAAMANVEWLLLEGTLPLTAKGDSLANIIDGSFNSAANVLTGLGGNDTYVVGAGDTIVETPTGGVDRVQSWSIGIDLALFPNVENASVTGSAALPITGTAADNVLNGEGSSGANVLTGLGGNDTYVLGPGDMAIEAGGGGVDTVQSGTIGLDMATAVNFENATLTGSTALNATGNAGANVLTGNAGANVLTGNGGGDTFVGMGGTDTLVGGVGKDVFRFLLASDSAVGAGRDVIQAFNRAEADVIDLAAVIPASFAFIGTAVFSGAAGELRYSLSGPDAIVQGSIAGGAVAFEIKVVGQASMLATDFLL